MKPLVGEGKPFHSHIDKAAGLLRRKVGTGAEFMKELMSIPGVKQTEIQERGLGEVLGMPKMTHEQFMAALGSKPAPAIQEKVLKNYTEKEIEDLIEQKLRKRALNELSQEGHSESEIQRRLEDRIDELRLSDYDYPDIVNSAHREATSDKTPYHEKYTLPGGENYREMLIKSPKGVDNQEKIMELDAKIRHTPMFNSTPQQQADIAKYYNQIKELKAQEDASPKPFRGVSGHFGGEPGILASMRLKDRLIPDLEGEHNVKIIGGGGASNKKFKTRAEAEAFADVKHQGGYRTEITPTQFKKLLHLEELQSDWHQEGRKKGYTSNASEDDIRKAYNAQEFNAVPFDELRPEDRAYEIQKHRKSGVPNAPFKKNWEEMALKRLVHHAAEKGYHGIVVTPGAEQADRYNMAKHISDVAYDPHHKHLIATGLKGEAINKTAEPHELPEYIGQELANKLLQSKPEQGRHKLSGLDIQTGGEGMKGFYDKKVPNILNDIGKKYGVKTQLHGHQIETKPPKRIPVIREHDIDYEGREVEPAQTKAVHYFPITEEMRKDVLTNGLPLYAEGGIIHKAEGGNVQPSLTQMKMEIANKANPINLKNIGVNEAPGMFPKAFFPPDKQYGGMPSPGGVATPNGMPVGGIDTSQQQPGQQLMPQTIAPPPPEPQGGLPGQPPAPGGAPGAPAGPTPPMGNMLQMTPQGQALGAMKGPQQAMAKGGSAKSVDEMKSEMAAKAPADTGKRVTINAEGPGGVKGIVVPRHTLEGNPNAGAVGLHEMNEARAKVYGADHREPLTLSKMAAMHKKTLADHFAKSPEEQHEDEEAALNRLREAKHIGKTANTLDESEKLDTVRHETDDQGRTHIGFASKGVAGHALYTSGHGKDTKYHVINTCPGQTEGCGGGKDAQGIVDTKKGTCFAPNAESQYAGAAVRRAAHAQAKHDPAMTNDWILAHTGSLRNAARLADKNNKRLLFRPNVVDETDVTSRHAIRHLNEQRKAEGKPPIIANSYGKTNELHDPENGYYVTHSNVGPKVKKGESIAENIGRDKARVRNTIMAADNKGDFKNEQGNLTPPKGSYMVTDVRRGSPMAKKMESHITHAKYWTTGREEHELTPEEKAEGPEGHFGPSGKPTSPDKAHFGHTTVGGKRFDYQKQHILHPRLVQVGENKDGTPHMIPTDSRFKDEEFLPEKRFMTKNGKKAGHILMTTPTESTSLVGHQTSFTHNVNDKHIEHAIKNKGEYEIDKPEDQIKAEGKEYRAPQSMKFYAEGGVVGGRHHGFSHDDFHAFPEQNVIAQRHLAMRHGEDEHKHSQLKAPVVVHKNTGTMQLEMILKKKAK